MRGTVSISVSRNRRFLFDGEMLNPGSLTCAKARVPFAEVSVFAEKVTTRTSELPTVFHNVWRSPSGETAAILVNWSRQAQAWNLKSPAVSGEGVLAPRAWVRLSAK